MLLFLTLLATQAAPDPLAPARVGKLQCYAPNVAKKTCRSIAGYALQGDGSYRNTARVLIAPEQGIAIETVSIVQVKGEAVCGAVLRGDLLAGAVTVRRAPLPADQSGPLLDRIADAFTASGMLDKQICTKYLPTSDRLSAEISVDGVERPDLAQSVIWIVPTDGYELGAP